MTSASGSRRFWAKETAVVMSAAIGLLGAIPKGMLKSLSWRTPNEAFNALLNRYLIAA